MKYQIKALKDYWFQKLGVQKTPQNLDDDVVTPSQCANQCQSYWSQALHDCGLHAAQTSSTYLCIDSF